MISAAKAGVLGLAIASNSLLRSRILGHAAADISVKNTNGVKAKKAETECQDVSRFREVRVSAFDVCQLPMNSISACGSAGLIRCLSKPASSAIARSLS